MANSNLKLTAGSRCPELDEPARRPELAGCSGEMVRILQKYNDLYSTAPKGWSYVAIRLRFAWCATSSPNSR